jgi:hypothetical protein
MKLRDAEKLLGGYAPGILSDDEKKALFGAALESQEIFDALMDEDILKQILDDPESRAKVLASLEASAAKVKPIWLRPLWIGAAASVFIVFMASYSLMRNQGQIHRAKPPIGVELAEESAAEDSVEAMAAKPSVAREAGGIGFAELPAEYAPTLPWPKDIANTQVVAAKEAPAPPPLQEQEAIPDEAPTAIPTIDYSKAFAARPTINDKTSESQRPSAAASSIGAASAPRAMDEASERAPSSPSQAPIWTISNLGNGRVAVKVVRTVPNAHIVLLHRGRSGVRHVLPSWLEADEFHFEIDVSKGGSLDLYQLKTQPSDYIKLPKTGPVDGHRVRIY